MNRNFNSRESKGAKAILSATCVLLAIQIGGIIYNAKDIQKQDVNLKNTFDNEYDKSELDELIYKEKISNSINNLFEINEYINLSEKLHRIGILKEIEVPQRDIDESILLKPDQINTLIDLLSDKSKRDEVAEMLKIEEALINEHIYDFAYNDAPKIATVVTKAQILDLMEMDEYEEKRLTTTSYESVCLNHDWVKKIAYVTGLATFSTSSHSDLGKYVILSLNLDEHEDTKENKQLYNKDLNNNMKKYINYLNKVIENDYELKDTYGGHVKKIVKSNQK